jgi:MATE family multidrug resistance protein
MITLSIPGVVNVLAEWGAFELLTLSSSWLSTTHLAAQAVVLSFISAAFSVPFAVSISMSTRLANLIGAGLQDAAKVTVKVSLFSGLFFPAIDAVLLIVLRKVLPKLMTNDADVLVLAVAIMPVVGFVHILDSLSANCSGIMRGIGRQDISGYATVFAFYVVGLPISFASAFWLHWGLVGLWLGIACGLTVNFSIMYWFIRNADWDKAVGDAKRRNDRS